MSVSSKQFSILHLLSLSGTLPSFMARLLFGIICCHCFCFLTSTSIFSSSPLRPLLSNPVISILCSSSLTYLSVDTVAHSSLKLWPPLPLEVPFSSGPTSLCILPQSSLPGLGLCTLLVLVPWSPTLSSLLSVWSLDKPPTLNASYVPLTPPRLYVQTSLSVSRGPMDMS